jgi:DNA-binding FadR family transcriptional regulator
MPELRAIKRVTLSEQVATQIAEGITAGRWLPGVKLPPETELCTVLNVGRSTLREALKSLAFAGLVRMRPGDGTYVTEPSSRGVLHRILDEGFLKTERDLADVCETRIILETELVSLAAERATAEDIERMEHLLEQGQAKLAHDRVSYTEVDIDFHLAIAHASKNRLLVHLLTNIRAVLVEWISKSQELPGMRENAHGQHQRIFRCIRERDPEGARREMQAHLKTFERAYKLLGRFGEAEPIGRNTTPGIDRLPTGL